MKRAIRAAALLLLVFLLSTTAFAAEDSYIFTPPEGYALAEGQTALWANAAQTANINIIVEKNDGVNPFDLSEDDIAELRDATSKAFTEGLAAYNGKVSNISAQAVEKCGTKALRISMDSSYTIEGVEMTSRQVQYIFFTKEHSLYITGTVLTEFADPDTEFAAFDRAVDALRLQDTLYTEATPADSNLLVIFVVVGAILGGAGGLTLYLLRQRKKTAQQAEAQ